MVQIRNLGTKDFINYIFQKQIYIFGAGKITENCIEIYCLNKKVEAVLDNNESLWGTRKFFGNQEIDIISVEAFVKRLEGQNLNNVALLIAPHIYAAEMISQLDTISQLDGLECYIHALIRNTKETEDKFDFTIGTQKIPKVIHYFWIGCNPMPKLQQKCIDSWRKFNPDYEILRWDESNYDFSKNLYMREAYENQAWSFATDYARLDVIYQYGGIYLDTDVEVISNLDMMLCDDAFFGMGCADRINIGVGFGGTARNLMIKELRDYYEDKSFLDLDGTANRVPCYYYQHPIFKGHGFQVINKYQKKQGVVIYPAEVMSPKGTGGMGNFFSDKTVSIHHGTGTWCSQKEWADVQKLKEMIKIRLNETDIIKYM